MTPIKSQPLRKKSIRKRVPAVRFAPQAGKDPPSNSDSQAHKRAAIASFCKAIGEQIAVPNSAHPPRDQSAMVDEAVRKLPPRVQETLGRLLAGDSEKEIGVHMGVSRNTIHVYVKLLYRHFDVNSRGELLARFVKMPLN